MKLFVLTIGNTTEYAAADSVEDMKERMVDIDPRFAYLPVQVNEVTVEGCEITVNELEEAKPRNKGGRPRKEA